MPTKTEQRKPTKKLNQSHKNRPHPEEPPSWAAMRGIFSCKQNNICTPQQPPLPPPLPQKKKKEAEETSKKCKKMKCSGSLCRNTTKVMHRPETAASPEVHKKRPLLCSYNDVASTTKSMKTPLRELNGVVLAAKSSVNVTANSSIGGNFRGMPFRRFSGCYECRMVVDPVLGFAKDPSLRSSICSCPVCGEIFMKTEHLELHQAVKHAVSELGPEDTSKNIVEIIFQSSWLKKETPICKIDRILKIQNTPKTISKFEEYRDSIKAKATKLTKKHPRCIADGNELLRFHSTTFACCLGLNGSSNLCSRTPNCNVCSLIKYGFKEITGKGILTTATSGNAHDKAGFLEDGNDKRAMLVCRVIAGRVKKSMEGGMDEYDSLAGAAGVYANLDELYVFNPKAILPCFVVIYSGF